MKRNLLSTIAMAATAVYFTAGAWAQVVIWSDDFEIAPTIAAVNTAPLINESTELFNTYYGRGTGGNNPLYQATGGNGGPGWLSVGLFGFSTGLTLAAPTVADTWTVTFDWQSTSTFGANIFSVWGLTAGQTLDLTYQGNSGGTATNLFTSAAIPNTGGVWVGQTYNFSVPTGYSMIVLKWGHDMNNPRGGIDNLVVTSAIPEPSSWALLAAGLGALVWLRRRRA